MNFPHSDSERYSLGDKARKAIESHDAPKDSLDPETREMREHEHTGIELTKAELAYLKNAVFDRMKKVEMEISELERSLRGMTASNPSNTKEEVGELKNELHFLKHNLAEKLFSQ